MGDWEFDTLDMAIAMMLAVVMLPIGALHLVAVLLR